MGRHKHKHKHCSSSSSSSSSCSSSSTVKACHTKKPSGWMEVDLPHVKCRSRKPYYDKALQICYNAGAPNTQIILRKKNANIAPYHLSNGPCKKC